MFVRVQGGLTIASNLGNISVQRMDLSFCWEGFQQNHVSDLVGQGTQIVFLRLYFRCSTEASSRWSHCPPRCGDVQRSWIFEVRSRCFLSLHWSTKSDLYNHLILCIRAEPPDAKFLQYIFFSTTRAWTSLDDTRCKTLR